MLGDIPYNRFERQHLPELLAEMDAEGLRVVVHDGDIKSGGERCDDALYEDRLTVFKASHTPFVFVPGDNDWTDCHRTSNGADDPLERLEKLGEVFFAELADVQQTLDSAFALWRANVADEAALKNLRRGFHTIKGSAQLVGATALGDFCRHMEQLAIRLMEQKTLSPRTAGPAGAA